MPAQSRKKTAGGAFTVPGLDPEDGATVATMLQDRLDALTDLSLTLKHIHWNVVVRTSSACTPCSTHRSTPCG